MASVETRTTFDTIVVGAGVSGVNAGYRLQEHHPNDSYCILEGRHEVGGTWSLFKYPGTRSDSDLYTFGFEFDPWPNDQAVATAPQIVDYVKKVAARQGIDKHILFKHQVRSMDWSSKTQSWKLDVMVNDTESKIFHAKRVVMGTGYYDYSTGLESTIPGIKDFKGQTLHPQFWPDNLDYHGKKIVIVGSGATTITLLPAMADQAGSVTMLQRSPGYIRQLPMTNRLNAFVRKILPGFLAFRLIRLRALLHEYTFFYFCRWFPQAAIARLEKNYTLPGDVPIDPHFKPHYMPWDQRMCVSPNGDLFKALRSGRAHIVTDNIESVVENGIKLKSGTFLPADIIVTATGLKYHMFANNKISVDGEQLVVGDKFVWRGVMLQDVPNFAFLSGYQNISWTLGADASIRAFCRVIKTMKEEGKTVATPKTDSSVKQAMPNGLKSNYLKIAFMNKRTPKVAAKAPWIGKSIYFYDSWFASFGNVHDGLTFK